MNTRFRLKSGLLSRYAFACGYVKVYERDEDNRLCISREPNDYHVKGWINHNHVWEIFEKVTDARKFIRSHKLPYVGK